MKHLLGEATREEEQVVKDWLNENNANQLYYDQFRKIWDSSKQLAARSTIDVEKAWKKFQLNVRDKKSPVVNLGSKRFPWLSVAASVILVSGIGILFYLLIKSTPETLTVQTTQNTLVDTLPDGSVITLNKESTVSYPSKFKGDTRLIALQGEAFFNVVPDKEKPFVISVNDLQVTVVGTSFNIKSENGNTEVLVETGIVRITRSGNSVEIAAGEKMLLTRGAEMPAKQPVTDKLHNYYRTKEFVCDDTPLWKLVQVLNDAYDANIVIERDELKNLRLNTTFNNESLDQILEIIHLTFDLKVTRKENDQIILH